MVFHSSSASLSSSASRSRFSSAASSSSSSSSSSPSPPSPLPFSECSRRSLFAADTYHSDQHATPSIVPFLWEEKPGVLKRVQEDQGPSILYSVSNAADRNMNSSSLANAGNGLDSGDINEISCENERNGCSSAYTGVGHRKLKVINSHAGLQNVSASDGIVFSHGHSQRRPSVVFQEQPRLRLPPRLLTSDQDASVSMINDQSSMVNDFRFHRRNASGSSFSAEYGRRRDRLQGNSRGLSMDDDPFLLAFMVCKNEGESSAETITSTSARIGSKSMRLEEQNLHFDQCMPRLNHGKLSMKSAFTSKTSKGSKGPGLRAKARALEGSSKGSERQLHSSSSASSTTSSSISSVVDITCRYQHLFKSYKMKPRFFPDLLGCRSDNARLLPLQPAPLH